MQLLTSISWLLLALITPTIAQFQFFEQMFQGQGHPHQQQQRQNVPSDSAGYREHYDNSYCDKYLCPQTLACVHFPHHCPCAWPGQQDKIELGEGSMLCASKGGFKAGEAARKIELARKGLL